MNAPKNIWICAAGKEAPDWIVERMTTADIAPDGSFEIEASDGVVKVEAGFAVFEINDGTYACPPKLIPQKLEAVAGSDNPVVAELADKADARRAATPAAKAAGKRPLNLKPIIGSPPAPQFALVEQLLVDDSYQRSIEGGASQKLIVKIAENWDWRLCLPLIVSRRQGSLYVIDGQHRYEAAKLRGDIRDLPIVLFDFDDPKAEAELFVQANRSRRSMGGLDDHHAAVVAGDAKALAIHNVVTSAGLTVGRVQAWQYWKPGEVVFIRAVARALNAHGEGAVARVLSMIARAFEGQVLVGVGALFEALCAFIAERAEAGSAIDDALMESTLTEVGIPGWKEATEGVNDGRERFATMLEAVRSNYAEAEAE